MAVHGAAAGYGTATSSSPLIVLSLRGEASSPWSYGDNLVHMES